MPHSYAPQFRALVVECAQDGAVGNQWLSPWCAECDLEGQPGGELEGEPASMHGVGSWPAQECCRGSHWGDEE